jgi:hypothetical protein
VSVEIQPAVRREMRCPASVIASAPASGASRQIQPPAISGLSGDDGALWPAKTEQT